MGLIETFVPIAQDAIGSDWSLNTNLVLETLSDTIDVIGDSSGTGNAPKFNGIEKATLDPSKDYLRLTRNGQKVYFQEVIIDEDTLIDIPKDNLDNAYIELFFDSIAVPLSADFSANEKIDALKIPVKADLITYLNTQNLTWYDITDRYVELIDSTETARINQDSYTRASNLVHDIGFLQSEVDDFGAVIAAMMLDVVEPLENIDHTKVYPQTIKWLTYVSTRDVYSIVDRNLQPKLIDQILKETFDDYMVESANSTFWINHYFPKHYDFIRDRIEYIRNVVTASNQSYQYKTSITDLSRISTVFDLLKNIWYGNRLRQSVADLESNIQVFATQLENLKKLIISPSIHF